MQLIKNLLTLVKWTFRQACPFSSYMQKKKKNFAHQIQTHQEEHLCISASGADMPEAVDQPVLDSAGETLGTLMSIFFFTGEPDQTQLVLFNIVSLSLWYKQQGNGAIKLK